MRNPRPKKISKIIKESLNRFVVFGNLAFFEDKVYKDHSECFRCKSSKRIAHGKTWRIFCYVIRDDSFKAVYVWLVRYKCKKCGKICHAKRPFYPQINYGKPMVDIALYFASFNPFNNVEKISLDLGIQIDRDTPKRGVCKFKNRAIAKASVEKTKNYWTINLLKLLYAWRMWNNCNLF